jgi:hypothetical protein
MQQFCTLQEVAETHRLSLEELIDEIKKLSDEGYDPRSTS